VIIHFELIVHIKAIARVFMLGQLKEKEKANGLGALIIESSHILVTKKREKKKTLRMHYAIIKQSRRRFHPFIHPPTDPSPT
jgi:hypothetical protein